MSKKRSKKKQSGADVAASNPKARHDYFILDSLEAGIQLTGSEVKSLRQGKASIKEAFAIVREGEVFLIGMHIPPYAQAGYAQHDPTRRRKLLLHKAEIERLIGKTKEKGLTLIPLQCYFRNGFAKIEIGLAKGKKLYDKRESMKERDSTREIDRAIGRRR